MAIYEDLVSKARLKVFLDEIKKHFPISVNGKKQDSNGNIVIPSFGGASASSNGSSGVVPAPLKGTQNKFLKGDGTWDIVSTAGGGTGLTSSPSMLINLDSTSAANVFQASPRPGVTGALPVANGGTGATSVAAAVKALLGSSAIGSSTKPLYYDGAALKACADSIGGGGIVAQLLEQNGYVKFVNGLILQWGYKDNSTSIVTFNLSFPTTCFIALVETLNDGTVNSHLRASGSTNVGFSTWDSATNRPYSIRNYWLALGI